MGIWGRKDQDEPKPTPQPQPREVAVPRMEAPTPAAPAKGAVVESKAVIGPSIHVKGELIGAEDLVVEGKVEGVVRLKEHHLIVGKSAEIDATLEAKSIRIEGTVRGDVIATERVELASGSSLMGDIISPRMMIADGARFKGNVDMDRSGSGTGNRPAEPKAAVVNPPATKPVGVS